MLIILLYHRAFTSRYGNCPEILRKHFQYLKSHHPITLPLDPLVSNKINICISFDDATFDFYHIVYPLLKEYDLKALLAVPASYIAKNHLSTTEERLASIIEFSSKTAPPSLGFCSFKELKEMVDSSHVCIASHGMTHTSLCQEGVDLKFELNKSKETLENALQVPVDTFVFPYGKYNQQVLSEVKKIYKTAIRIGNGLNFSWKDPLLLRINADQTPDLATILSFK
ncbi:MAG: polysaccharide deacetylase family protein, partial [Chlamydiota bacterium]